MLQPTERHLMRIAVPIYHDMFCEHFGRADSFMLCEVDDTSRQVDRPRSVVRPKPKCETVPDWLKSMGVTTILAGGVGAVAQHRCKELGMTLSAGHSGTEPHSIVRLFLEDGLGQQRANPCSGLEHRHRHCHSRT
jgi:predicted Fe-Mo cluster-binding NifX family protein